jgi:Transposase DDE domain group 1
VTSCYIPQLSFSFYRHRSIRVDFSGGQITSDAGLLPLRAFDERHSLTRRLAELLGDPREEERVRHSSLSLFRQRIYQIIAGYEDANDADRLRHDPAFQILADQPLGDALGSQPTLTRWENAPSARNLVRLNQALLEQFIRLCGAQVRQHGEILLDVDSTDDPTHGQQQLSFFNGAYGQHMYHPMLIFERHTGCLLSARLRPGNASSHARIVPMLLSLVPRLQAAFPGVLIKLRGDAGFALPLLYEFCEFFGISYVIGIPRILSSSIAPNDCRRNCSVAIAAANSRSAASPAFPTVPVRGPVSVASVIRPSIRRWEPICVSWLPTARAVPRRSSLFTMIAENARTASKSSKTASTPTV